MCDCGSFCGGISCAIGTCVCGVFMFHVKELLYDPTQPLIAQLFGYTVEIPDDDDDDCIYTRIMSEEYPQTKRTNNNISSIASLSEHVTSVNVTGRYDDDHINEHVNEHVNEEEKTNNNNNEMNPKFTIA